MLTVHRDDIEGAEVIMDCDGWAVDPPKDRKRYERILTRALRLWPHPSEVFLISEKRGVSVAIVQRWNDVEPGEWIHLGTVIGGGNVRVGVISDGNVAHVTFNMHPFSCSNIPSLRKKFDMIRRHYTRRSYQKDPRPAKTLQDDVRVVA